MMLSIFSHWIVHFDWFRTFENIRESFEIPSFFWFFASASTLNFSSHTNNKRLRAQHAHKHTHMHTDTSFMIKVSASVRSHDQHANIKNIHFIEPFSCTDEWTLAFVFSKNSQIYFENWNWKIARVCDDNDHGNDNDSGINKIDSRNNIAWTYKAIWIVWVVIVFAAVVELENWPDFVLFCFSYSTGYTCQH